jgi:hypothetical protein
MGQVHYGAKTVVPKALVGRFTCHFALHKLSFKATDASVSASLQKQLCPARREVAVPG